MIYIMFESCLRLREWKCNNYLWTFVYVCMRACMLACMLACVRECVRVCVSEGRMHVFVWLQLPVWLKRKTSLSVAIAQTHACTCLGEKDRRGARAHTHHLLIDRRRPSHRFLVIFLNRFPRSPSQCVLKPVLIDSSKCCRRFLKYILIILNSAGDCTVLLPPPPPCSPRPWQSPLAYSRSSSALLLVYTTATTPSVTWLGGGGRTSGGRGGDDDGGGSSSGGGSGRGRRGSGWRALCLQTVRWAGAFCELEKGHGVTVMPSVIEAQLIIKGKKGGKRFAYVFVPELLAITDLFKTKGRARHLHPSFSAIRSCSPCCRRWRMEDLRVRILLALDKCTRKHLPHGQERSVEVSVKGITILKKLIA